VRILGIDCGTERTGYGVIDSDGVTHRMVEAGVVKTSTKDPLAKRLVAISCGVRSVVAACSPDCAAVEDVFHAVNARSALKLAHARGAVLLTLAEAGLPVGEYSPLEVKMSVVGFGRAEKHQVQMMVRSLLALDRDLAEDAADAAAVAICHATRAAGATVLRIGVAG
jgi:crossover junction endodeoxyribonuclease RuvC